MISRDKGFRFVLAIYRRLVVLTYATTDIRTTFIVQANNPTSQAKTSSQRRHWRLISLVESRASRCREIGVSRLDVSVGMSVSREDIDCIRSTICSLTSVTHDSDRRQSRRCSALEV